MLNNIISAILGFFARLIYDKISEKYPKVVFNVEQSKGFNIPASAPGQHNIQIWQHTIHLANFGKKPATNIVITHEYLPSLQNISPHAINKTHIDTPHKIITIDSMAPKEGVDITYLNFQAYSTVTLVTYDQGIAKHIPLLVTIPPKKWLIVLILIFTVIGIISTCYFFWVKFPQICTIAQKIIEKVKLSK
jgi:hypothetical protein